MSNSSRLLSRLRQRFGTTKQVAARIRLPVHFLLYQWLITSLRYLRHDLEAAYQDRHRGVHIPAICIALDLRGQ